MKYILTFFVSMLFVVPSFAQGRTLLTVSRALTEDMARKTLPEFTRKYLVTVPALNQQVGRALLGTPLSSFQFDTQELDGVNQQIAKFSNCILRTVARESAIPTVGGYIPSFAKDSKIFAQKTGFTYSDMARMLSHTLEEPAHRNFFGYFVKDFRELQRVAINPATGQTLGEALRCAYQQAKEAKSGILVITEETPSSVFSQVESNSYRNSAKYHYEETPRSLKDMYVMDWANGRWISYQKSVLNPLREIQQQSFPNGAVIDVTDNQITVAYGTIRKKDDFSIPITTKWVVRDFLFVHRSSPWYEQLKYAKEKGYYVQVEKIPGIVQEEENPLSNVQFLFARQKGDPLFDNVYELERGF